MQVVSAAGSPGFRSDNTSGLLRFGYLYAACLRRERFGQLVQNGLCRENTASIFVTSKTKETKMNSKTTTNHSLRVI